MQLKSKSVLLALIAVFAMSAVAASAASAALPEFKPMPTKKKFTSTSGTFLWRVASEPVTISCSKTTTSGEITSSSTFGKMVTKFTGCQMNKGSEGPCPVRSVGGKAEEIVTSSLKGELGTVSKSQAASEVGMLLEPETGHELWTLASIAAPCSMPEVAFEGNIAGEVSAIGKKQSTSKLAFAPVSPTGKQKIAEITVKRGLVKPKLIDWGADQMTLEGTDETTFEEALEVTL
jgi:hypothetical protein